MKKFATDIHSFKNLRDSGFTGVDKTAQLLPLGILAVSLLFAACRLCGAPATADLTRFVDPFVGTAGTGHCFPGPCRPLGLVQPSPETGNGSWRYCSGYDYDDTNILCFAQTHLNGTGQASLGDISVMPVVADVAKRRRASRRCCARYRGRRR